MTLTYWSALPAELQQAINRLRMKTVRHARHDKEWERKLTAEVGKLQKTYGVGTVGLLSSLAMTKVPCFGTGYRMIDDIITGDLVEKDGRKVTLSNTGRGLPKGRIIEIFGPESCGKTTLTLHFIAAMQTIGGVAAFVDAEHAIDFIYAEKLGCDTSSWLFSQPNSAEETLEVVSGLVDAGVDLIVVDSVAAMTPQKELDGDMGDQHMGLQARLMSQACRKLTGKISKSGSTVIFINQTRQKIGVMFGNPETTTGGNALKFYASVRLRISNVGQIKEKGKSVGSRSKLRAVKNKVGVPFREVFLDIKEGRGIVETHRTLIGGRDDGD